MHFLQILRKSNPQEEIRIGCQYQRAIQAGLTETAEVMSVAPDAFGIPHVQFRYSLRRHGRIEMTDRRTLAAEVFRGMFPALESA
ncbi:MAG: hypothetical protein AAF556_03225 [Pseudomonadota bacterium]